MRVLLAIFVAVIFCVTVSNALDDDPFAPPPYCWPLTNFTIANGTNYFDKLYNSNTGAAIFFNGRDPNDEGGYGFDHELWDWGLWGAQDWFSNDNTGFANQDPDVLSWAVIDGTSDTFDVALSFTGFVNNINISFTAGDLMCGQDQQSVIVPAQSFDDVAIELLFYAPPGNSSSWARTAIQLQNNGQASADVTAILVNNWGSDSSTVYMVIDDHYCCSADNVNITEIEDSLICYYWKNAGSKAAPYWWYDYAPVDESEWVLPAWNWTLAAGQIVTILQFASQNSAHNWTELQAEAAWINSNPLQLYAGLPQSYYTSLVNFDMCEATFTPTVSVQTACTTEGGKATLKLDTYPELANLSPMLKIGDNTYDLTTDDTIELAAGTYDVSVTFGGCIAARTLPQVTVDCVVPPTAAPVASTTPTTTSTPTTKKSSASSVGVAVVGWAFVLGALLY